MLDVFSYSGGWSMYGSKAGVKEITAVDSSAEASERLQREMRN